MSEEEKQKQREYNKRWCESHKDKVKEYKKQYYESHKEQILKQEKEYYENQKNSCVYKYIDLVTNETVYIGSTNNIVQRNRVRLYKKDCELFTKIYQKNPKRYKCKVIEFTETVEEAREIERVFIQTLSPKFNIQFNANFDDKNRIFCNIDITN